MRSILIISCLILSLTTSVDAAREIEPNNHWLQGTLIDGSEPVTGLLDDERDYFKLLLPETGEVTVTLDKYPDGADLILEVLGFRKDPIMPIGKVKTRGRDSLSFAFDARDRVGYLAVITTPVEKICKNQWCITRLTVNGPYYRQQSGPALPTSWEGQPIIDPPDYRLTVIHPEMVRKRLLEEEARNAVADLPLFRDARYGVQFRYPPDWTARSASENRIVATPNRLAADHIQVVVGIRDKSFFPGSSPDLQLNLAEKTLLDANARIAKRGEMKVMQRIAPYLLGIYPESGNGPTLAHLQLVLDHGDQYYWISYTAPSEIYPDHTPEFATILKTFDIIPPEPQPAAAAPEPAE